MNYDLRKTNKESRKRFLRYANSLLKNERSNVCLIDESDRTLNQNSYLHVLCRILASYSGVTEDYAKQVYFKRMANPDIFVTATKDPLTNQMITRTRSTTELTITRPSISSGCGQNRMAAIFQTPLYKMTVPYHSIQLKTGRHSTKP